MFDDYTCCRRLGAVLLACAGCACLPATHGVQLCASIMLEFSSCGPLLTTLLARVALPATPGVCAFVLLSCWQPCALAVCVRLHQCPNPPAAPAHSFCGCCVCMRVCVLLAGAYECAGPPCVAPAAAVALISVQLPVRSRVRVPMGSYRQKPLA